MIAIIRCVPTLLLIGALIACATEPSYQQPKSREEKAARVNVQLGIEYLNKGNLELAKLKLERALRQDPDFATVHWSYALLQMRLGNTTLAEKHFRRAIALDPADSRARNNYGIFLCNQGEWNEAQEQFRKAVENPLYNFSESAFTNAGVCMLKVEDTTAAENYFRKALKTNRNYAPALIQMVKLTFNEGYYLQSRAFMQRFEQTSQHNSRSLWLGYRIEHHLGNLNDAEQYAVLLKRQFPESRETKLLLELERNGR